MFQEKVFNKSLLKLLEKELTEMFHHKGGENTQNKNGAG